MRNILLLAGVTIPAIYFANLFGVGAVTPGFDHGSTLPSDLGREDAGGAPQIFNLSLIAVGVCGVLAAIGLFLALRAFGVSMISYGVFPLPDPRHHSLDLLLILSMLTPVLGALALKHSGTDRWIVLAGFAGILAMVALSAGVGGVANESNIGWIVRAHAAVAFATFAYLCWAALRRSATAPAP